MERLTENWKTKNLCENDVYYEMADDQQILLEKAIDKLAEYEDTGLEPSEIERLKANQNKVAIEKLEEVLKFIYGNKWTNIELCVDNSPLKIIRNKLDTMISGLKGDK